MSVSSELLNLLQCPVSGERLRAEGQRLVSPSGMTYSVVDGVPWLLDEARLSALDRAFQRQYTEKDARSYDRMVWLLSLLLGCWEPRERRKIVGLLDLKPGMSVLEVSVGTGANLPFLARTVGSEGRLVGLDLSPGMLGAAQKRARALPCPVHLVRGTRFTSRLQTESSTLCSTSGAEPVRGPGEGAGGDGAGCQARRPACGRRRGDVGAETKEPVRSAAGQDEQPVPVPSPAPPPPVGRGRERPAPLGLAGGVLAPPVPKTGRAAATGRGRAATGAA